MSQHAEGSSVTRILLVEDHENLGSSLQSFLRQEGFEVDWVKGINEAKNCFRATHSLVILDWMLPDGQGIDFLKQIRAEGKVVPVIFLTARVDLVDRVLGLEMGASDYVTKPFEKRELVARVRARLREVSGSQEMASKKETSLFVGSLEIDRIRHRVLFKGNSIELVKKEFELLALLAESPDKVFSREEILNKVWGYDVYPTTRTVDTHIMLLRHKIHNELIETVRAVGYRLKSQVLQ